MSAALNALASLALGALLFALALRAWQELLGKPLKRPLCLAAPALGGGAERKPLGETVAVFFASLAVLWLLCFVGYLLQAKGNGSLRGFFSLWISRFTEAGDAPHYLYLAEHGYAYEGERVNLIVFYPLYPLLTGLLGRLLGGSFVCAAMLISQLSFGISAVLLYRMARFEGEHALSSLAAYLLYPFAFFALGVFTEGLFLALSLATLWALSRKRFAQAGILGFFTILCRVQGIALIPVYLYAAWRAVRREGWRASMLCGLLIPLGWGLYLLLNRHYCGDFFAFRYYESIRPWWQETQWLGKTIAQQLEMARQHPFLGKIIYIPQLILYFLAAGLLMAGLCRGMRTEYAVFGAAYLGMCYLASWLISGGRYMLGCAGVYFALAKLSRRWVRIAVLLAEALAALWFYANFMNGQSIM